MADTIKKVDAVQETEVSSAKRYEDYIALPPFTFPRTFVNPDTIAGNFNNLFGDLQYLRDIVFLSNAVSNNGWGLLNSLIGNFNAHTHGIAIGAQDPFTGYISVGSQTPATYRDTGYAGEDTGVQYPPMFGANGSWSAKNKNTYMPSGNNSYEFGGGARLFNSAADSYNGVARGDWNSFYGTLNQEVSPLGKNVIYADQAYSPLEDIQLVGAKVSVVGGLESFIRFRMHETSYATNGWTRMKDSYIMYCEYTQGDATNEFGFDSLAIGWDRTIRPDQTITASIEYLGGDPHSCSIQFYARKFRPNVGQEVG